MINNKEDYKCITNIIHISPFNLYSFLINLVIFITFSPIVLSSIYNTYIYYNTSKSNLSHISTIFAPALQRIYIIFFVLW